MLGLTSYFRKTKLILLSSFIDYLANRKYYCFIVESEQHQIACNDIIKEGFRRVTKFNLSENSGIYKSNLIACARNNNNKIIGVLKLTDAMLLRQNENYTNEFKLDVFSNDILDKCYISTHFCVSKSCKDSKFVSYSLLKFAYYHSIKHEKEMTIAICKPNLYLPYLKLGFKPFSQILYSPEGGYRLPIFFLQRIINIF